MDELSDNFLKFCSRVHGVSGDFGEINKAEKSTEIRRLYVRERPPPVYIDSAAKVTIKAQKTKTSKAQKKSKKGKQNTKKNTQGVKKIQNDNSPSNKNEELQKNTQSEEAEEQTVSGCSFMPDSNITQNYDDIDYSQMEFIKDNIKFMINNSVESAQTFSDLERQFFKLMEADVENEKAENVDAFSECEEQVKSYASVLKSNLQKEKSKSTGTLLKPTSYKKIGKWKKENIVYKFTMSHL